MRPTITVPPLHAGPKMVPYPAAFERAKAFLKQLLQRLWATRDEYVVSIGPLVALQELVHQLQLYAR